MSLDVQAVSGNTFAEKDSQSLPISHALKDFLSSIQQDADALASQSIIRHEQMDTSHPIASYFISSSHNTYLQANQLTGGASADNYTKFLTSGCRCVEIDAWWDDANNSIKVTHGYTLTSKLDFRSVCQAISEADSQDQTAFPIIISLECHVPPEHQPEMVRIMKEVFGSRLVTDRLEGRDQITLQEAMEKILVKVEHLGRWLPHVSADFTSYRSPEEEIEDESSSDSSDDEETRKLRKQRKEKPKIVRELQSLGVYTTSIKPVKDDFLQVSDPARPSNFVVNISESALGKLLPHRHEHIVKHNSSYGMRVYPQGLRVTSRNLNPLPFWKAGAQIAALNFQTFDRGVQMNSALFAGSQGWILKPAAMRGKPSSSKGKVKLQITVKGASALPIPPDAEKEGLRPYIVARLFTHDREMSHESKPLKSDKRDDSHGANPIFDEVITFEYDNQDLVFLRLKLVHKDSMFSKDDPIALAMLCLDRVIFGEWRLLPLLSINGGATQSSLLVKLESFSV